MSDWISVDERLPRDRLVVLVYRFDTYEVAWYADHQWVMPDDNVFSPTHWQPLPLPPQ